MFVSFEGGGLFTKTLIHHPNYLFYIKFIYKMSRHDSVIQLLSFPVSDMWRRLITKRRLTFRNIPMKKLTLTIFTILFCLNSNIGWSADFQKGLDAYNKKDYATALKEFQPLAENKGIASYFYSKEDIIRAQYKLGQMYHYKQGVPQDYKTAVKWYRLAAKQGNASAQTNLGIMYRNGLGVIKDYVYAYMWWSIAGSYWDRGAAHMRDIITKQMTPSQIETAQKLARECVRKKYKGC